jgi:hypothetical protein
MTRIIVAPLTRSRNNLSRIWIQTGNPAQPLACIWIDNNPRTPVSQEIRIAEVHLQCA